MVEPLNSLGGEPLVGAGQAFLLAACLRLHLLGQPLKQGLALLVLADALCPVLRGGDLHAQRTQLRQGSPFDAVDLRLGNPKLSSHGHLRAFLPVLLIQPVTQAHNLLLPQREVREQGLHQRPFVRGCRGR